MSWRAIRMGLVGGGPGSFIGPVHRLAAEMDGEIRLLAGAFSNDARRSLDAGRSYGIDQDRAYSSVEEMIAGERGRADSIQMIVIATPNHLHLPAALHALEAGLAVMSDKPATATLAEAQELRTAVIRTGGLYGLTFAYTGYPMIREARAQVAAGTLGEIRKVVVEYLQGWLAAPVEQQGNKQAAWRVDPQRAGPGGCISDIGVHAFNLAEFVTGLPVTELSAELRTVVPGRQLDDDCTVSLRFSNGAEGSLMASQVATGERNHLRLRIYGEHGGLDWSHEAADQLKLVGLDGSVRVLFAGAGGLGPDGRAACRLPAGHPEGYHEAFANLYRDFAQKFRGRSAPLLPGIEEGLRSMAFVTCAIQGSGRGWTKLAS